MSLRLRELRIRISTPEGLYGTSLSLPDGLVIIRTENTTGKSTCLQAILYALGLEGMLGPSHDVPLPHAVTDEFEEEGRLIPVLESSVLLEIENAAGDQLAIQRVVTGELSTHLIRTWDGPAISVPEGNYRQRDYFVREGGAAQRERGFHRFLETFIGWELPEVGKYDGTRTKLYMEVVVPLMYVEQKKGWGFIEARFPSHFGIREVSSRAMEFLLGLDAFEIAEARSRLASAEAEARSNWKVARSEVMAAAKLINGYVKGLPTLPTSDWPPPMEPHVVIPAGDDWVPAGQALDALRSELERLESEEIPRVDEVLADTQARLDDRTERLLEAEAELEGLLHSMELDRSEILTLQERVRSVQEDLTRYKDLRKLEKLGSDESWILSVDRCPTCLQAVSDALLPQEEDGKVLSIDENVRLLTEQERIFRMMLHESERAAEAKDRLIAAKNASVQQIRREIRGLKKTLVSDGRLPSMAAIENRVHLADELERTERAVATVDEGLNAFAQTAAEWASLQEQRRQLPEGDLSERDLLKLDQFEAVMLSQLRLFGMASVDPARITLSRETYRPMFEGFDLQFDISASDTIRTIWAYRLSLLELAREYETNHLGLLILDEPRQQEASVESVWELLRRASAAGMADQQVLIATSERLSDIQAILKDIPHSLIEISGWAIGKME